MLQLKSLIILIFLLKTWIDCVYIKTLSSAGEFFFFNKNIETIYTNYNL
jgi:hypothetical protein